MLFAVLDFGLDFAKCCNISFLKFFKVAKQINIINYKILRLRNTNGF
ncbi:hypothetical protein HFN_0567 [Helicobacter fennelliae MRY12-0050]|uniref:Uncharacterized protein n=1 Tax=Helicobacter fennelliae MRY12-0050 TaxID=1325130 RepID=T1D2L0_9HELI|nr:hypothetical protein HFN_0567 [Helicobacter fennelliae MRY12-0050]